MKKILFGVILGLAIPFLYRYLVTRQVINVNIDIAKYRHLKEKYVRESLQKLDELEIKLRQQELDKKLNTIINRIKKNKSKELSRPMTNKERYIRTRIAEQAIKNLKIKYVWGGTRPEKGFDCSGLAYYVYNSCGIKIPRTSKIQYRCGLETSIENVNVGDLVFFQVYDNSNPFGYVMNKITGIIQLWPNHIGIYMGNGEFIHSPKKGGRVEIKNMSGGFWRNHVIGVRNYVTRNI